MKTYKTILAMLATVAAFASCTKDSFEEETQNIGIALDISYADDTKAIQKNFMTGNVVYIFFNSDYKYASSGSAVTNWNSGNYLKMVYDGTDWQASNTSYLSKIPKSGTMNVIYMSAEGEATVEKMSISPYRISGNGVTETLPNGEEAVPCYDALQAEAVSYTISNSKLSGSVKLVRKKPSKGDLYHINLQISVKNIPADLYGHEWYLKSEELQLKQISFGTYTLNGNFNIRFLNLNNGVDKYCKCINLDGDKLVYGGKNSSTLGSTLKITLYDKTARKTYSRSIDVNAGNPSIKDLWTNGNAHATNTAIAVNFSGFTEQ